MASSTVVCPTCNAENDAVMTYCTNCGARLPVSQSTETVPFSPGFPSSDESTTSTTMFRPTPIPRADDPDEARFDIVPPVAPVHSRNDGRGKVLGVIGIALIIATLLYVAYATLL